MLSKTFRAVVPGVFTIASAPAKVWAGGYGTILWEAKRTKNWQAGRVAES